MLTGIQYSSQRQTLRIHSVLHHVTFKATQGKPGLNNIIIQISVQCEVCACVAMPPYKCLNYTVCWGERGRGGEGQKNRQQVRSQLQRSDKPVFASFGQCSQVLGQFKSSCPKQVLGTYLPKTAQNCPKPIFVHQIVKKTCPKPIFRHLFVQNLF